MIILNTNAHIRSMMTAVATYPVKQGDIITISGWGYDRKGREIKNGYFVASGKKTRAKIVKLKQFEAELPSWKS